MSEIGSSSPTSRKLKLVFIVSKFPCYDEAFILREMHALSKQADIRIFSLRDNTKEKIIHDQAAELLPLTIYVPYFFSLRVLGANLRMLLTRPARYAKALGQLITGNLKSPEFLLKGLAVFPKAVFLADWMLRENVDMMHAYWATYPASVAMVASEISGLPFSFTGHAHDIYLNTTHLKAKIERAKFVSTCTSHNKDYLKKLAPGVPEDRIFLNYHGLDLSKFDVADKKRGEIFEILSVGTLNPHKGFNYLIPALTGLERKGLRFHCTIIGGGPLEADLKNQIRDLGLGEKITMTGPLKQAAVIPYYKKADLMVLMAQPEWHWGIPNVLIEAVAAKAPVITTQFGSVDELVKDGKTGLIVSPKDSQGLADAIQKLSEDNTLRTRLMEEGRKFVLENFDLNLKMREFLRRFEKAVKDRTA